MRNLLNESFARLYRNKTFRVCLVLVIALPTFLIGTEKILIMQRGGKTDFSANDSLFNMLDMMPLFIAIAAGLFIAQDFRQNTIRNKIICGYSRTQIYIATWITSVFIAILFYLLSTAVTVGFTSLFFKTGDLFTSVNLYYFLIAIPTLISFASVTVMMTMILRNTAGAIFSYFIHVIISMLSMIAYILENKAPAKFLNLFLPMYQLDIISSRSIGSDEVDYLFDFASHAIPEGFDAVAMPLYAAILIVIVSALGILNFNKSNVK